LTILEGNRRLDKSVCLGKTNQCHFGSTLALGGAELRIAPTRLKADQVREGANEMIDDPLVERVIKRIADAIHPEKIILFGSRATATARPDSDLDLLVICNEPASKREMQLAIRDLFPVQDFSMDVFVLTTDEFERQKKVVSTVGRTAFREGVVCYG